MKKYLFLIATAITMGFISCSEEECDHGFSSEPPTKELIGAWYNEELMEEDRYHENGSLYAKFCNPERSNEIEGRYEYDQKNNKVSWFYTLNGQSQFRDWTIKDLTDFSLTIASDQNGTHKYGKIVETYQLEVGETANILFKNAYPSYTITSYSSINERLASVTSNGLIKAEGEKGTTYIKISTNQGVTCWVKVVVGDDCLDLWYDYVSVIGISYDEMRNTLSSLGEPYNQDQDYAFGFIHEKHDLVDIVKVYLDPSTRLVTEIQILIKDGVPEAKILSYMNSHYYEFFENENHIFYSTLSEQESSKAIVAYDKTKRTVFLFETQSFFDNGFWPDFTSLFATSDQNVKAKMDEYEYPYLMTDYSYSVNGSDYYQIIGSEYATMVGFVFNPDNVASEYWVYINVNADLNKIYNYLQRKYEEESSESTNNSYVFYAKNKTIKIVFDLNNDAVIYTNLTLKQHETPKEEWVDYSVGLGMTKEQIIERFGIPYSDEEDATTYWIGSSYVNFCIFNYDSTTNKCNRVTLFLNKDFPTSDVTSLMSSKYEVYEFRQTLYSWIDGETLEKSNIGISYYPDDYMIIYYNLK